MSVELFRLNCRRPEEGGQAATLRQRPAKASTAQLDDRLRGRLATHDNLQVRYVTPSPPMSSLPFTISREWYCKRDIHLEDCKTNARSTWHVQSLVRIAVVNYVCCCTSSGSSAVIGLRMAVISILISIKNVVEPPFVGE